MTAPAYLVALRRHCEDLRDGTHAGVADRAGKERVFERAVEFLDPVARQVLAEVDQFLLERTGEIGDDGLERTGDGTLSRSWRLSWPEQRDRGIAAVTLTAWFGGGFHHPHLRGGTVHDWPLNVYDGSDARELVPILRGIVAADVHNLIFQADWRIVPAVVR
ncbi:MAG: hypothetical protein V7637_3869 [Mycobacteriales bacterium]|jgi:hypothetical protein